MAKKETAPETTKEETTTTAITPTKEEPTTGLAVVDNLMKGSEAFVKKYSQALLRLAEENITEETLYDRIGDLDMDSQEALVAMIKRMDPNKKGVIADNDKPIYTDLRLFQGVGNDINRPDDAIPGQFYLTTKERVGKEFYATVICMWEGRSMWGDMEDGGKKAPICQSMDRKVGAYYGDCETCPERPWKDGKRPEHCHNEVSAFLLSKDLKNIVRVRFQRTSEPAGNQLLRYMRTSQNPWSRWYKISSEAVTSKHDTSHRYFVMKVDVAADAEGAPAKVDKGVQNVCDALCSITEQNFLYPSISDVYRRADNVKEEFGDGTAAVDTSSPKVNDADYATMDEPEV